MMTSKVVVSKCYVEQSKIPCLLSTSSGEDVAHSGPQSEIISPVVTSYPVAMDAVKKSEIPMHSCLPGAIITLSNDNNFTSKSATHEMPVKLSAPTNSMRALQEQSMKLEESQLEENTSVCNSDPILPSPLSQKRDLFVSELSGQALAIIYTIPKVKSDAIIDQAAALKFKTGLVESEDDDEPNVLIILDHEEKVLSLEPLLRAVRSSKDDKIQAGVTTGLTILQASAAVVLGAVGAWVALALA
ncbi:hypothetical protein HYPSUDRAFT_59945 [Hypholoma sublateritium FD-334 SS-4]|uniref:Uncharacterized protein n=1 Tax=Hypholoma sublateritium (strain FD-334 SS-4) TaxID=945553 RepID=A0A0D2KFX3_HYPSF|nr:hypothetical protein HYPSUDRAFT_59945 [Hypholoma sublateritium FD-334 SS-4]